MEKQQRVRPGWRVLLEGRDVTYGGLEQTIAPGDSLSICPPGR
ncbi:MAG: hypothetical protein R3248_04505 [Candidatus Promineifilaceae bacterium]|nr:hypothetical protein [Candidatus Promineifilaceae bacterium]